MKYLVRAIAVQARADFEFEAETQEDAMEQFKAFASQAEGPLLQPVPPGQNIMVQIGPLTDIQLDKEENNATS